MREALGVLADTAPALVVAVIAVSASTALAWKAISLLERKHRDGDE